jgi:hypothetical protein
MLCARWLSFRSRSGPRDEVIPRVRSYDFVGFDVTC